MICQTWTIGKAIRALFADRVTYQCYTRQSSDNVSIQWVLALVGHPVCCFVYACYLSNGFKCRHVRIAIIPANSV